MSEEYPATTLLLIRHAQARASDSSHLGPDTPIGQLGRLQVAALVSRLVAAAPPTVAYTSPLPRAVQTASLVCERLGLEAVLDPRLTEFEMGTKEIEVILERPDLLIWHPITSPPTVRPSGSSLPA
jgi:broad specificity phosphatase PhoE